MGEMAKTKGAKPKKAVAAASTSGRINYFKQTDFPQFTLQQAQRIATAIVDNFAGASASPPDIAIAMNVSPSSSAWRALAGASIAYGLTEGGHNANEIKLAPLGKRLVAPEEEGDDVAARREAILRPRLLRDFFDKYRRAKFPADHIAVNVVKSMGIPADRAEEAIKILKDNGRYAGVIKDTPTGMFINLDSPSIPAPAASAATEIAEPAEPEDPTAEVVTGAKPIITAPVTLGGSSNRVFISHGKQRGIVAQIKELLAFGSFEPVVSVERESTAVSVPEKVFEDMRSCAAGVIHVGAEGKYLDKDGNEHIKINDNVLIEIGAAMALYGKKIILLVEKGVPLPSNLQGLYRCEFEGDKLDYEATMKLLKTFSQFR
jgi:hypothetical protein